MAMDEEESRNAPEEEVEEKELTPEELSLDEFAQLEEAPEGARRHKVNYEKVLEEIEGHAMSVKKIGRIIMAHAEDKKLVYYSEVTGFLQRLAKSKRWKVEKKFKDIVYYRVTRLAKTRGAK